MATDGERIAVLGAKIEELREDMADLKTETVRTRSRLHDAEGLLGTLVDQEKMRRQATYTRQRRMERRVSILAVVVSAAAIVEPFLYHLANGG